MTSKLLVQRTSANCCTLCKGLLNQGAKICACVDKAYHPICLQKVQFSAKTGFCVDCRTIYQPKTVFGENVLVKHELTILMSVLATLLALYFIFLAVKGTLQPAVHLHTVFISVCVLSALSMLFFVDGKSGGLEIPHISSEQRNMLFALVISMMSNGTLSFTHLLGLGCLGGLYLLIVKLTEIFDKKIEDWRLNIPRSILLS